jgi:hypothetical protein
MAMLMMICPIAHREVPTGVTVEPANFDSLLDVPRTTSCHHCGGAHVWSKREAWLSHPKKQGLPPVCSEAGGDRGLEIIYAEGSSYCS